MSYVNVFYPESKFGGFPDIEETIAFYTRVNALIQPSWVLLDAGCGKRNYGDTPQPYGRRLQIFKGRVKKVLGIDTDKSAKDNPYIDEFRLIVNHGWPVENESIDLCLSDSVLEHVENPELFFFECNRVIKPGGYLCLKTPNVLGYVGLFSKLIPNKYHAFILSKLNLRHEEYEVYPTLYRCNTIGKIKAELNKYNFENAVYGYEGDPCYLSFSKWAYFLGTLHQKLVPNALKVTLFAFARKPERNVS